jgi:hypothetical protein
MKAVVISLETLAFFASLFYISELKWIFSHYPFFDLALKKLLCSKLKSAHPFIHGVLRSTPGVIHLNLLLKRICLNESVTLKMTHFTFVNEGVNIDFGPY